MATTKSLTTRKKPGQNPGDPNAAGDPNSPGAALMRELQNIKGGNPGRLQEIMTRIKKLLGMNPPPKKK